MTDFQGKILLLGFGSVARCALPILFRNVTVAPNRVTVMDFEDKTEDLREWTEKGVVYVRDRVTPDNLGSLLGRHVGQGDLLIDLAWNIDCVEILTWCHEHGVLYVNTSVEQWDPYAGAENKPPTERTLYFRHMAVREAISRWTEKGATAVIEHGANPGLISHWTKQALLDVATACLDEKLLPAPVAEKVQSHAGEEAFNHLAMDLGVKVIHCSERDTQIADRPKEVDEFVNTWSVEGFREEGTTTAEMGWGTHEKELPAFAFEHVSGPKNQICLARMGMNTFVRSWVPDYEIHGMVVRHGEAFTISDHLTVWEDDRAVYRPTVHYAYCPSDAAIISLHELRGRKYELQPQVRIMDDEITTGADILGALIMGHPLSSWWVGSDLDIDEARRLIPHQNATTIQVAISVIAAVEWMIQNPQEGVNVPDDLPHEFILNIARPYLGRNLSIRSNWNPLKAQFDAFGGYRPLDLDRTDPWQFKNFLVTD